MPKIGVFWFYKGTVIGRSMDIDFAEDRKNETLDSPDTHTDLWDNDRTLLREFPELFRGTEYFAIPRGRVLWKTQTATVKIFMDSVLFNDTIKQKILAFFELERTNVQWKRDSHYTTTAIDIDALFVD